MNQQDSQARPVRIAIFASGGGSNARTLLNHFQESEAGKIVLLATENPRSGILDFGPDYGVPAVVFPDKAYREADYLLGLLAMYQIDLLVLAGYLKKIPDGVVQAFPERILNIHPSLLPAYGGKGMYGMHVHRAVMAAGETFSGMTVHYVNEVYDQGQIVMQEQVRIGAEWSPEALQQAVLKLEHKYYPIAVEKVVKTIQIADK
jgi:phosphoribosylglycinamide formyltransferase 1